MTASAPLHAPAETDTACPPSGVSRLTAHQVRDRMQANGWGTVPIIRHDHSDRGAGKRPVIGGWQKFAKYESDLPSALDLKGWDRRYPGAPGTGVPCGSVIAIDVDVTDTAILDRIAKAARACFGATPFIRQGRAPKLLLVYRAAEPIAKRAYKVSDRTGDGLDILAQGSQFVAFGIHPLTHKPYAWIGDETPLTASPDAAPEITAAQIDDFVERVRAILPLAAPQGARRGPGGETAEIVRDNAGFVVDGREAHLTRLIWQAANRLHDTGEPVTAEAVTNQAWAGFCATARLDVDGRVWTRAEAALKTRSTLDRVRRKVIHLGPQIVAAAPTYSNEARPLAEAEGAVASAVEAFFVRHAHEFANARRRHEIEGASNPLVLPPTPRAWCLKIEAGIGKTAAAIKAATSAVGRGLSVVYAVPRVDLGDEVVSRFAAHGVEARVYRGREKVDPDAQGETMCLNLSAVRDASKAFVRSVYGAVCAKTSKAPGEQLLCHAYDRCGHIRQRRAAPAVWVVPHALLFGKRPAMISRADALVIDEGFYGNAIPNKAVALALDLIEAAGLPGEMEDAAALANYRARLVSALRRGGDGPVSQGSLLWAGLDLDSSRNARRLEWRRAYEPAIFPGQDIRERARESVKAAEINRGVRALAGLWSEIATFLEEDFPESGRLTLTRDEKTGARQIERRSLSTMDESWGAATLILDATAPPASVLAAALGFPVVAITSIAAAWSPYGHVRQIIGAPVSNTKLGIAEGREGNRRIVADLRRLIAYRAALGWPRIVGVVVPKGFVDPLKAEALPANVDVRNFGALAGLDAWRNAAGVIVIGRTAPTPAAMEAEAGVITGRPALAILADDGRKGWYPRQTGGIRLVGGSSVAAQHDRHPDPVVEGLRWQVCEANLIQAVGRIRPLRRDTGAPFFLDIVSDVPLPITVSAVVSWEAVRQEAWTVMASEGMILASEADIGRAYPALAPSRKAARLMVADLTLALRSIKDVSIDQRANVRWVAYKRVGRLPVTRALMLPNGPIGDIKARHWLEERVGPIAHITVERLRGQSAAIFERVGRSVVASAIIRAGRYATASAARAVSGGHDARMHRDIPADS